jgi:outer membrane protein assembly factor BamA
VIQLRGAFVLTLALLASAAVAEEAERPKLVALATPGATAFTGEQVRNLLRLKLEAPLYREPAAIAQSLEQRYKDEGYPAARVTGAFDPDSGTLTLTVSEGRIAAVSIDGLEGKAAEHALESAALPPGSVLRTSDIEGAFLRLDEASEGALTYGTYVLTPEGDGVNVALTPALAPRFKIAPRFSLNRASGRVNRVDGWAFPVGAEVTIRDRTSYNHTALSAVAAYAWSAEDWRYALGAQRSFGNDGPFSLGYEYHDFTDTDDLFRLVGVEEAKGAAVSSSRSRDFFRRTGHELYAFLRLGERAEIGLSYRNDEYRSLPVTTNDENPNPEIDPGLARSFIATVRYSSRGNLFEKHSTQRHSYLQRSLYGLYHNPPRRFRGEVTFEWAPDDIGGELSYRRVIANLRFHKPLSERQTFDARVLLGVAGGDTPLQKRLALGGDGTLRGYEFKEFRGDSMGLVTAEYGVMPRPFLPKLIAFYDGGRMWRDAPDDGWKSDVGLGLRFPPDSGGLFGRVDFSRALSSGPVDVDRKIVTTFRLQIPF